MAIVIDLENRIEKLEQELEKQTKINEKVVHVLGEALNLVDSMEPEKPKAKKKRGKEK
jgi:hypothetical protein|tara:strand:+ start:492 stop:665 length:174 start_codon:yes stop_codon:yes gene_type:complete